LIATQHHRSSSASKQLGTGAGLLVANRIHRVGEPEIVRPCRRVLFTIALVEIKLTRSDQLKAQPGGILL
jgi:hypothetical protein